MAGQGFFHSLKEEKQMTDEIKVKGFRGGLPYGFDVQRLNDAFPTVSEGLIIKHETLEPLVRAPMKTGRYYAVINSWIKQQRERAGIIIQWVSGIGVKVLDPGEILTASKTGTKQKLRQTQRKMKLLGYSDRDRLNQAGQLDWDHTQHVYVVLRDAVNAAKKTLPIDVPPIKSLPKPKLVPNDTKRAG
jgi:hypothetical protein